MINAVTPTADQAAAVSEFVDAHRAEANSIKGHAYQAVNTALNNVAQKVGTTHGFVGQFRAQAITNNRIARHSVAGQALENDPAIQAFATKGIDGKTAGLAYA